MRRKLELTVASCWDCPYLQQTRGRNVSEPDGWCCKHPSLDCRLVIDNQHRNEFSRQYLQGFPTWCPLPITDAREACVTSPATSAPETEGCHKWVLTNGFRFELKDCIAYPSPDGVHWSFFALRSANGRTTAESYRDYDSFEEIQGMFDQVYGFGAEWRKEQIKPHARKA